LNKSLARDGLESVAEVGTGVLGGGLLTIVNIPGLPDRPPGATFRTWAASPARSGSAFASLQSMSLNASNLGCEPEFGEGRRTFRLARERASVLPAC